MTHISATLALILIVGLAVPASPGSDRPAVLRQAAAIPTSWRIQRELDLDSGRRSCALVSHGGDVTARLAQRRSPDSPAWSVLVGYDNQPGSLRYLRINRVIHTTAETGFDGAEAAEIVEELKSPGEFAFEWAKRPDFAKRLGLYGTGDFAAKAAVCEDWIEGTRA